MDAGRATLQTTFLASITAQVVALVLSIVALAQDDVPGILRAVLIVGFVVAAIQFCWYVTAYAAYFGYGREGALAIKWRYLDWYATTGIMLLTLNLLIRFWRSRCISVADAFDDPGMWVATIVAFVADALMLTCGLLVETERVTDPDRETKVLFAGFVPFVAAFLPSFLLVRAYYSVEALLVTIATFLVWGAYGYIAIAYRDDVAGKALRYNLADIVSKNIFQVAVAIQVLADSGAAC